MPFTERDQQIEVFSKAIDALLVSRKTIAERGIVESIVLDETMCRLGRAFSLCWDLQHNRKGGRA